MEEKTIEQPPKKQKTLAAKATAWGGENGSSVAIKAKLLADEYNPVPQGEKAPDTTQQGTNGDKLVCVMVGLPARGKTYMARKLARYLSFFYNAPTKVFNVGNYRRAQFGVTQKHDFFDTSNVDGTNARQKCAESAMTDLKQWLAAGREVGRVGIFDATNTTKACCEACLPTCMCLGCRLHLVRHGVLFPQLQQGQRVDHESPEVVDAMPQSLATLRDLS